MLPCGAQYTFYVDDTIETDQCDAGIVFVFSQMMIVATVCGEEYVNIDDAAEQIKRYWYTGQ